MFDWQIVVSGSFRVTSKAKTVAPAFWQKTKFDH